MKTIILVSSLILASCAANVKHVDESLIATQDLKGQIGDRKIGVKDGSILIQEQVAADDELRVAENVNLNKRQELESEEYALNHCNKTLAISQGLPKLPEVVKHDIWSESQREEKLGLAGEDNALVIVKTADYKVQLVKARKERVSYEKAIDSVIRMKDECEYRLQSAKIKAVAPSSRSVVSYDERG